MIEEDQEIISSFFDSIKKQNFSENMYIIDKLRNEFPEAKSKKIIDSKNEEGDTLLLVLSKKDSDMVASNRNFNDFFDLLIHLGADVNVKDTSGKTALDYARENGNDKMVKMIEDALATKGGGKRKSKKSKKRKSRKSKNNKKKRKTIRKRRK